jgi:ribosomal-protein-alanine N-acetyltransferase
LRQFFDLFGDLLVVAERDGTVIGYALGGRSSDSGWILGVAVEPSMQGGGVGRALTEALLDRLNSQTTSVTVHPDNTRAVTLYRRLGFEQVGLEPEYFGEGKPRLLLRRRQT